MEIEQGSQSHAVNDIFGYRKIVWNVVNYFPGTCGNDWIIRSPEFSVYSPILTKWQLSLRPIPGRRCHSVSTYLERLKYGPFPDKVQVNWKLYYPIDGDREIMTEHLETFQTNHSVGTNIPNLLLLERKMFEENKNFIVRCHIIVYTEDNYKILEICKSVGLKSLSQDLSVLCVVERGADSKLYRGSTDTVNLHRAVVSCRNRVLKDLLRNDAVVDLHYPLKSLAGVHKIIRFLYTGDLKYVLRSPSFSTETAVEYYDVDELKEYYSYDELTLETEILTSEAQFKWTVTNLDKITEGCILGHKMRSLAKNEFFRLALYPKGIGGAENHVALQIKFSEAVQPRHLYIIVGVFNIRKKVQNVTCKRWSPSTCENIIFDTFVSRHVLEDPLFVTKGRLKLFCRLQRSGDVISQPVIEKHPVIKMVDKYKHFVKLSEDVASLLETGDYSDITVESGVLRIKAHKMILNCRSYVLAKMLAGNRRSISFPNVEQRILPIILHYLYSGVLRQCKTWEILKIYDAAKRFCIQALINTCSHILRETLHIRDAVDVLIDANKHKDLKLKLAAFKFICCNITEIQTRECWQRLMDQHQSLYGEWTQFFDAHGARLLG